MTDRYHLLDKKELAQAIALKAEFEGDAAIEILGNLGFEKWEEVTVKGFNEVRDRFKAFLS